MGHLRPLFSFYFRYFSSKQPKFYSKLMWKSPSSILCQDSNSRPSDYESPALTTRPALPPVDQGSLHRSNCFLTISSFIQQTCLCDILNWKSTSFVTSSSSSSFDDWDFIFLSSWNVFWGETILLYHPVWPEKNRQMSIKVAQKWFQ